MKRLKIEVTATVIITIDVEEDATADLILGSAPCNVDDLPGGEGENVRAVIMDQDMEFEWEFLGADLHEPPKNC